MGLLAANLAAAGHGETDYVILVKPQFEAGKGRVGKGGVVTDPAIHRETVEGVMDALGAVGLGAKGLVPSPIHGAKGNREFLLHLRPGTSADLSARLAVVSGS